MPIINQQVHLISRPGSDGPSMENFSIVEHEIGNLNPSEILLKTLFFSLDPYMRARMYEGKNYAQSAALGKPMIGATVSKVIESRDPSFAVGDIVESWHGWQSHHVCTGASLKRVPFGPAPISTALGVLGMPGLTGYGAMLTHGRPVKGETVVVSAATGPVGSVAGQVAKAKGARVIGIAGGPQKCRILVEEFGLAGAVDHRAPTFAADLQGQCPDGIDIYYDNVGGEIFAHALPLMNKKGRILVCGTISVDRDRDDPVGKDRMQWVLSNILIKQLTVTGFLFDDFTPLADQFHREVSDWIAKGQFHYRENVVAGIENAPDAFLGLFRGENIGKLMIQP
jgi:NADPH-dependent curcumin reductase